MPIRCPNGAEVRSLGGLDPKGANVPKAGAEIPGESRSSSLLHPPRLKTDPRAIRLTLTERDGGWVSLAALGRSGPCRRGEAGSCRGSLRLASAAPRSAAPLGLHPRQRSHAAVGLGSLHPQIGDRSPQGFNSCFHRTAHWRAGRCCPAGLAGVCGTSLLDNQSYAPARRANERARSKRARTTPAVAAGIADHVWTLDDGTRRSKAVSPHRPELRRPALPHPCASSVSSAFTSNSSSSPRR